MHKQGLLPSAPLPCEPATRALPHAMNSRRITHSSSSSKHHRSPALSSHPTPSPPARPTAHSHSRLGYYRQSIYQEVGDHIKGKGSGSASVARGEGMNEKKERGNKNGRHAGRTVAHRSTWRILPLRTGVGNVPWLQKKDRGTLQPRTFQT
jgi:hypothetical protein